jgi:hypothetical protein
MAGRGLRPHPGKHDALIIDVVGVTGRHRLASIADLSGAERVEKLDAELAQYEPDEEIDLLGLLDPERPGRGGPVDPGTDGPLTSEVIDLFGSSRQTWLRTRRGVWFLPAGDDLVFIAPGDAPGRYAVARCPSKAAGGQYVHESRDLGLDMAMAWGEQVAADVAALTRKNATWRRGAPSSAQAALAAQLGAVLPETATKGEVSDAISIALASQRIDPMPIVASIQPEGVQ